MIPFIIKWIFIFALWIAAIVGINVVVIAALAFVFSLAPAILFNGIVIVFMAATIIWLAWEEASEHV
ncbi:MAG: hypothetical protein UH211_03625 [Agathobacter sp.]|nr:hypothetical protein [Agathobacter sp.]